MKTIIRNPIIIPESWEENIHYGYVYITTDLKTHKMYVGKKEKSCFDPTYFGSGVLLLKSFHHRPNDFVCKPIDWADSKDELNTKERYWIEFLECLSDCDKPINQRVYYNILSGGDGGRLTGESLQKMKNSRKGKCLGENNPNYQGKAHTEQSREKIRNSLFGRKLSEETKHKISVGNTGKKMPKEFIEMQRQLHLGSSLSEETRAKISKNRTGKMTGVDHPLYGTHLSEERKQLLREKNIYGNSARAKKVYKYDLNMNLVYVYSSRSNVVIDGYKSSKISGICCSNDRSNDTTYVYDGFIFSSEENYQIKSKLKTVKDAV